MKAAGRGSQSTRIAAILTFVRERGFVHPREVDEQFSHGTVTNYWGGSSNATTHLLELMHYRGLLRIVRRDRGEALLRFQQAAKAHLEALLETGRPIPAPFRDKFILAA